jgi:hypothetical protein
MLKKVFILTQFGPPHSWSAEYLAHIRTLAPYGWHWIILTPHDYQSSENVRIVPMTLADFDARVLERCGVVTGNFLDAQGLPVKFTSDYYPAFGDIFSDLLTDADYWSITNWDVLYGRLDHFLTDAELDKYDIWSDDRHHINSLFCFYNNTEPINRLYRCVPGWERFFQYEGVPIYGFDEVYFDAIIRQLAHLGRVSFGHPPYFALHSYDRLIQHQPKPNLAMAPDGALIECFDDPHPGLANYAPWRGMFGREIMYFHFLQSKRWPELRPYPQ